MKYVNETQENEKLLLSKANDASDRAFSRSVPSFLPFLTEEEQMLILHKAYFPRDDVRLVFFGGYHDAEHKAAGFFPEYLFCNDNYCAENDFPIKCVFAKGSGFRKLTHRDFLGSLMALGIKRETIGDIVVCRDGYGAYIFCLEKTAEYLCAFFENAANDKIVCRIKEDLDEDELPEREFETITTTVSSLRIDAIISACMNVSREEAERMINSGNVSLDHSVCLEKSKLCPEGSVISVKHGGRFILYAVGDKNRKDRLRLTLHKPV